MSTDIPRSVVVTDSGELLAPGVERLRDAGVEVTVLPDGLSPAEAAEGAAGASVVIDGAMRFGAAEIERMRAARLIVRAGIGYDVIDVEAATRHGIWVANVPDYCVDEVADHTLLLLLASTRRWDDLAVAWRREERWYRYEALPPVHRPAGRTLGIVGLGRIGQQVAKRARAFGWTIIAHDAVLDDAAVAELGARPVGLDALFAEADAITLHCPLTDETRHLVDARRLALAKPGLVVVNTSRGGLVDIEALDAALESGRVSAAGIDVLEDEPDVDLGQPIMRRENALITPHVAWYSVESKRELALLCADEALRVLDGEAPRRAVNPEARA